MLAGRWSRVPRPIALLLNLATVSVLGLAWLMVELVDRDRRLEGQRRQEHVDRLADQVVTSFHLQRAELEAELQRLAAAPGTSALRHTIFVVAGPDGVVAGPGHSLVFLPALPPAPGLPPGLFAEGERLEHTRGNYSGAIASFAALARSEQPTIRAAALVRLGRTERKDGRVESALRTYADLAGLGGTPVDGLPPAEVIALSAMCTILEGEGRKAELAAAARRLVDGLIAGRWPIRRDVFDYYTSEARRWIGLKEESDTGRDARALAVAFGAVHDSWRTGAAVAGTRWLQAEGRPVVVASAVRDDRLLVLLGSAAYLRDGWLRVPGAGVFLSDGAGQSLFGTSPAPGTRPAVRTTDQTGLPWTLRVASTATGGDADESVWRSYTLAAGLSAVLLLLGVSGYVTLRGISRELSVARLQSDFVSAVSHEFRTPLASVRHLSDMLVRGRVKNDTQRLECYEVLSRESERLENLVEELLDFGRIESGQYVYRLEPTEAVSFVGALVADLQEKLASAGYRIEVSFEVDNAMVAADRQALGRAVRNLVDNAVKYSGDSRRIVVTVQPQGATVAIRVQDWGIGIPTGEQEAIFGKFVRGTNARDRQIKGTGIGLAMVRHIVAAHRGDVRAESEPGQGSAFTLRIPMTRSL